MGKQRGLAMVATKCADTKPERVAQSVHLNFTELVAMFDRQLCSLPDSDGLTRSHVAKAKAAAERGLKLSQDLIAALSR